MSREDTALDVLATVSGVPRARITRDQDLVADLGIDSPKALRLLVELEEALDIEVSDDDAAKMSTVGDVLDYLRGRE